MHRIEGLTDDQLRIFEDRAEMAMRAALQLVMNTIADRIGEIQTASGMPPWNVLLAHMPGKHNQKDHGRGGGGRGAGGGKEPKPSGGGPSGAPSGGAPAGGPEAGPALTGSEAYKSVPSGYSRSQGLRPRPKGMSRTEVEDAETSLRIYQGASSGDIQAHLRGTGTARGLGYSRQASDIQTTMDHSRLQEDIVVYRGIRHPETTFTGMGGRYGDDMTGVTLTEKGFLSTSTKRKVAVDFADQPGGGGVLMEIRMPAGTGAVRLQGVGESEVLGQSGLQLTVVEDRGFVDGQRHLVVEAR